MKIMKDNEMALVKEILSKLGASEEDQELVAEATVDADLKGFTSHGLGRFPQYLISIESGTINLEDNITIEKETPASALINGNSGFGQAVSYKAMQIAIKKAIGNKNSDFILLLVFENTIVVLFSVAIGIIFANLHDQYIPQLTTTRTLASVPFGCRYRLIPIRVFILSR